MYEPYHLPLSQLNVDLILSVSCLRLVIDGMIVVAGDGHDVTREAGEAAADAGDAW